MDKLKADLDAVASRASRFTGRMLKWSIRREVFHLEDETALGNLALVRSGYGGGLREAYMRIRHFGLTPDDLNVIHAALCAASR